ncbi:DYW_deaminase domain-containing protein [Psidium guajava]|nr:DYW_deaminase domain-containing protein [Psidium guajava]
MYEVDYLDTFSLVAKLTSIRILISLAAIYNWLLFRLNVENIFLHGTFNKEVHMEQLPRFVARGESSGLVCKLKNSLYGLKQSPRAWFGRLFEVLLSFGLSFYSR